MLFGRRLGFSGTPSDLLPFPLRPCHYEQGSEALIVQMLTNPAIIKYSEIATWSPTSLLDLIATSRPPNAFHALIDTGALVTGMTNKQVAEYLLKAGLTHVQACVYLDDSDSKMALFRDGRSVPLSQCGLTFAQRFTFYDQVHTTGMDIKQSLDACAAVTLGKDMTLRDLAQGCWRMRGLGQGQTVQLLVVNEVLELVREAEEASKPVQALINGSAVAEEEAGLEAQDEPVTHVHREVLE